MRIYTKSIFIALFILFSFTYYPCHARDNIIELYINDEVYHREYPVTLEESLELIDSLVDMHNEINSAFSEYRRINETEKEEMTAHINLLKENLLNEEKAISNISFLMRDLNTNINSLKSLKNSFLVMASFGPSYSFDENLFGYTFGAGFLKSVNILNLYAGLNLNSTIYYFPGRSILTDIGVSLYLGMFLN